MSRDRRDAADRERDAVLLTAYAAGDAELAADDRRRVEARLASDPAAGAEAGAVRALLGRLHALPPEGAEPDWAAMASSIHRAVGAEVPRPWWRRWTWLAPLTAAATAAAVLVAIWPRAAPVEPSPPAAAAETIAAETIGPEASAAAPASGEPHSDVVALWLDGATVEVDLSAAELLGAAAGADDTPEAVAAAGSVDDGLLPASPLSWVDHLDDETIAQVERWLDGAAATGRDVPAPGKKG